MEQARAGNEAAAAKRSGGPLPAAAVAAARHAHGQCRFCGSDLSQTFIDLGMSPLCESYLSREQLDQAELFYPLHVRVCERCFLVQLEEYVSPQAIFSEYAYFSSYSLAWLGHARAYAEAMVERLRLTADSLVVELGSNDGYLLQYFVQRAIPVLGIEPAANVAAAARTKGVPTRIAFFGAALARELAAEGRRADLIIINNVLAQVPDLGSFLGGVRDLLKPAGVVTIEVPHLMRLVEGVQFDTIYHEHFSYFSFLTLEAILAAHGLAIFEVEELWTHGGSLRIYAGRAAAARPVGSAVGRLRARERAAGYDRIEGYAGFEPRVRELRWRLLECLIGLRRAGKTVVGYGAPGKGNTLLNYCGIRSDLVAFTVDRNPYKHGKFLPGTHIPIHAPERLEQAKPDYVLILPWNLRDEIIEQLAFARAWGARFIVPIPEVTVC